MGGNYSERSLVKTFKNLFRTWITHDELEYGGSNSFVIESSSTLIFCPRLRDTLSRPALPYLKQSPFFVVS